MRIRMIPGKDSIGQPNGISRVISAYFKYANQFGVEFVDEDEDLLVVHAGMTGRDCDVAVLHGLYFTGDYPAPRMEYSVNS